MKKYKLHCGTFDVSYYLIVGKDFDKIEKFLKNNFHDDNYKLNLSEDNACFFSRFNYSPVVWIPKKPKTEREYGSFVHELLHLVFYVLTEWASVKHCDESEEVFTHLLSTVTTDCLKKLN